MKATIITSLVICFLLMNIINGCDSSVEPAELTLWEIIDTTKKIPLSLDAGGFFIPYLTNDTGYYYDIHTPLPLKSNNSEYSLRMKYEFGIIIDGKFTMDTTYFFLDKEYLFSDKTTIELDIVNEKLQTMIVPVGLGRRKPNLWNYPYACRLTFYDTNKKDSFVVVDSMIGSYPANRFRGYINTVQDPDILEDGPDDGDWKDIPEIGLFIKPAYRNPDGPDTYIEVALTQPDTIFISLNITRNRKTWPLENMYILDTAGTYMLRLSLLQPPEGLYRVYITVNRNGKSYQTYGDVRKKYGQ
jgi:hypothetical protein